MLSITECVLDLTFKMIGMIWFLTSICYFLERFLLLLIKLINYFEDTYFSSLNSSNARILVTVVLNFTFFLCHSNADSGMCPSKRVA